MSAMWLVLCKTEIKKNPTCLQARQALSKVVLMTDYTAYLAKQKCIPGPDF